MIFSLNLEMLRCFGRMASTWKEFSFFADMSLSCTVGSDYHRKRQGKAETVSPQAIANELKKEFHIQLQIKDRTDTYQVRYEDFCQNTELVEKVKRFVNSPISETGKTGQFNIKHPVRRKESRLHGNQITTKRVSRWQHEKNRELVQNAHRCFSLIPAYTEFWNYEE